MHDCILGADTAVSRALIDEADAVLTTAANWYFAQIVSEVRPLSFEFVFPPFVSFVELRAYSSCASFCTTAAISSFGCLSSTHDFHQTIMLLSLMLAYITVGPLSALALRNMMSVINHARILRLNHTKNITYPSQKANAFLNHL